MIWLTDSIKFQCLQINSHIIEVYIIYHLYKFKTSHEQLNCLSIQFKKYHGTRDLNNNKHCCQKMFGCVRKYKSILLKLIPYNFSLDNTVKEEVVSGWLLFHNSLPSKFKYINTVLTVLVVHTCFTTTTKLNKPANWCDIWIKEVEEVKEEI